MRAGSWRVLSRATAMSSAMAAIGSTTVDVPSSEGMGMPSRRQSTGGAPGTGTVTPCTVLTRIMEIRGWIEIRKARGAQGSPCRTPFKSAIGQPRYPFTLIRVVAFVSRTVKRV